MDRNPRKHSGLGAVSWAALSIVFVLVLLFINAISGLLSLEWLALYWPLLLIAWGSLKVAYYRGIQGDKYVRFSNLELSLLVVSIFAGSSLSVAAHVSPRFLSVHSRLSENIDLFNIIGNEFEFSNHLETKAPQNPILEIHNIYGFVEVVKGEEDRIVIDIQKTVRAASLKEAFFFEPQMYFAITNQSNYYVLRANRYDLQSSLRRRFKTSLKIRVPRKSSVRIRNSYGSVQVMGLTGNQKIRNFYGRTIIGKINGDVDIEGSHGEIVVENVSDNVLILNKQGNVHVADIGGDVKIKNRSSRVNVEDVMGSVQVEGDKTLVTLKDIAGSIAVENSQKNLVVENVSGKIDLTNRVGNIRLRLQEPPQKNIVVNGEHSDIFLEIPQISSFLLDARMFLGSFDSNFPRINRISSDKSEKIKAKVGTGSPSIIIKTNDGNVSFNAGGWGDH